MSSHTHILEALAMAERVHHGSYSLIERNGVFPTVRNAVWNIQISKVSEYFQGNASSSFIFGSPRR